MYLDNHKATDHNNTKGQLLHWLMSSIDGGVYLPGYVEGLVQGPSAKHLPGLPNSF